MTTPAHDENRYEPDEDTQEREGPDAFKLGGELPQVMRLSRKALAAIGAAASLTIGGALIYALQPQSREGPENLVDTESRNRADNVISAPADYGKVPKLGPPLPGDLGGPIVKAQDDGKFVPLPPIEQQSAAMPPPDPALAAAEQARRASEQERDSARTSRLFLGTEANSGSPGATPSPATPAGEPAPTSFLAIRKGKQITSAERIERPASPNILQAGSIIPAALITGIRSDLPGQITAQVTQNVYDSPTGRILLIPQGSRLIGEYDSEIALGQNRVLLAWDRLLLPGGRSILLDRFPGADASGKAGLSDRTEYHWGNMLKAALISTLLGAGTEIITNDQSDLARALRFGTQDTVSQTGRQVVERELKVPPTLTVRPGFALRIIVTRDLIMEPAGGKR